MRHTVVTFADVPCECKSNFTDVPQNLAVFAGSDCVLKCAINDYSYPLAWNRNSTVVYSGYKFGEPFQATGRYEIIEKKTGTYNLRIRRVQPSDAGEYDCGRAVPTIASAQLVIIGMPSVHVKLY